MCEISKIYNQDYIYNYLKNNKLLIVNICDNYNKQTFEEYYALYKKYKDIFICDWFPKLWAIVFYKNKYERSSFLEIMSSQLGDEFYICAYNSNTNIKFQDNKAIITYNQYLEYITFDEEKNVG